MKNNKKHLRPAVKESYERGLLGLWFILSSEGENSEHLSQSINQFLEETKDKIKDMKSTDFNDLKKSIKESLGQPSKEFK